MAINATQLAASFKAKLDPIDVDNGPVDNDAALLALAEGIAENVNPELGGGGGSTTLSGLSDVSIASLVNGQILVYNSGAGEWENVTPNYLTSVSWGDVGGTLANQTDLQNALDGKEPTFSKNTAFNKDFGTVAGTVVEGSQLANYQLLSEKGQANGYAGLDGSGKVPAAQLPSYVDDVEEYADLASFPVTGEAGKIYIDLAEGDIYRWTGTVYAKINDAVSQADQALKWSSPITLTLTGDVSGDVSFDGSANVNLNVTVSDDSHNHIIGNIDGLQTALDGKLSTSATTDDVSEGASNLYFTNARSRGAISVSGDLNYDSGTGVISFSETYSTATELLNAIKTVDGSGSGLDADRLDGQQIGYGVGNIVDRESLGAIITGASSSAPQTLGETPVINDDDVFVFNIPKNTPSMLFVMVNNHAAIITVRATSSAGTSYTGMVAQFGADIEVTANQQLTGTTGTDGKLNIAVDGVNANQVYIENRVGATRVISLYIFG